ncbi:MAG TPA: DUF2065 domain-containing protein [Gammaproteobacteria bacterium]|nr:DUF2065 domain-containing protein [Gammaproteobacteria bacterium]
MALYLVIEGLFPFASPRAWRRGVAAVARLSDPQLRSFGLAAVIAGLLLLLIVRS